MFICTVTLLLILLYFLKKSLSPHPAIKDLGNKIPGPNPLPLFGNVFEIGTSPKSMFQCAKRLTKQYGPICRVWLGPQLGVLIQDPHYAQLLLGTMKHLDKSFAYEFSKPFGGNSLLFSTGEVWKLHRKIISPTLGGHLVTHFLEVFNSNLDPLIDLLSQHQDGPSFNLLPIMTLYTLENVCEYCTGVKLNIILGQDSGYARALNGAEETVVKRGLQPWLYPDAIFRISSLGRQQARHVAITNEWVNRVLQARKQDMVAEQHTDTETGESDKGMMGKRAFVDRLLLHRGTKLSDKDIQDEVNTIMGAGHDTTAASLSFTCWLLAKHQDVQEKVIEELRRVFGGSLRHATVQDLYELKYLGQVIKESLRILPPAPVFGRRLKEDLITDQYVIPAGSEVAVNVYMLHRHPEHFPDPERFDPDRFLPENCANRHPYAFIPFSSGPRNCVGYKFALHQLKTTMATVLRHFRFLPPENPFQDLDLATQVIMKSLNGVPIKLQPRYF